MTGAKGLLGTELVRFLERQGEEVLAWDLPDHDVTQVENLINAIHGAGPDVIFHLAAWTDVDACEGDPGRAAAVNFQGAWAAALGAAEKGCKLVYISTDYVFDGKSKRPYRENDRPNPLSVYGRTKLLGEQAVARSCKKRFIARTSWLYGRGGRNFVDTIRAKSASGRVDVVDDQMGSPTYARDLCRPLWDLSRTELYGTYHLTNSGRTTWYDLARAVVELTGVQCEVVPVSSEAVLRPAPRPAFSVLDNRAFRSNFARELRPWREALEDYLRNGASSAEAGS